jgi:hypothetical protein
MDLRLVAFDLIARDIGLRALLVNYADRLEDDCGDCSATAACFLALQWSVDESRPAAAGSQLLTARAHLPRQRAGERLFLDFVLDRVRAALARTARNGSVAARYLGTSREFLDSELDTISKTSLFQIAPAPPPPHDAATLLTMAPWPVPIQVGADDLFAPNRAGTSRN